MISVRRVPFLRAALLLLALAATAGLAPAASAGEGERGGVESSAVERLTPDELTHLQRNVPDWDDLPDERRERIAKNVLRIREMPAEERARLRDRMERFRKQEPSLRERLPERLARLQGTSRERFRVQALVATAVGREVLRSLPEKVLRDLRRAMAAGGVPPGGAPPGGAPPSGAAIGGGPVGPTLLGYAFSRALMEREAEATGRTGEALRHVPSPEARDRFETLLAKVNVASPEDRPRELRALAMLVVEDRAREALRPALAPVAPGEAASGANADREAAVVAALQTAFPDAWRGTSEDLLDRARRGPEDLRRFLARHGPKPERRAGVRSAAFLLVRFLEQAGPWLAANPEAREHADRLVDAYVVKGLGLPPGAMERLPGWDRPADRLRALKRLLLQGPKALSEAGAGRVEGPRDR